MPFSGLSEKAKGKQRAIEPLRDDEPSRSQPPVPHTLTIRFTDGKPDLIVKVHNGDNVRTAKGKVNDYGIL